MIKYLTLLLCLGILNAMAYSSPCPTCPKGYSVIKMEELLSTHYKQQSSQEKVKSPKKIQKTPIEMVKNHSDQLKKTRSDTYITKSSEKIDPPANQFRDHIKRLEQYSYKYKRRK